MINLNYLLIANNRDMHDYIDIYLDPVVIVFTFFLGYVISNKVNMNQEVRRINRVFDYFKIYFENQIHAIEKQLSLMIEQKNKVADLKNASGLGLIVVSQPFSIFEAINKEELFSAWVRNGKNKQELIKIFGLIDFLKVSIEGYVNSNKEFNNNHRIIRNDWNQKVREFHELKVTLLNLTKQEIIANKDLIELNSIYNQWIKSNNTSDYETTVLNLINPIETYYKVRHKESPEDFLPIQLIKTVQEIQFIYNEWKNSLKSYESYLAQIIEEIQLAKDGIDKKLFRVDSTCPHST